METDDTPWLYMQDLEGVSHRVSEEVVIGTFDVEGVTVESDRVVLHFKPASWKNFVRKLGN